MNKLNKNNNMEKLYEFEDKNGSYISCARPCRKSIKIRVKEDGLFETTIDLSMGNAEKLAAQILGSLAEIDQNRRKKQ